MLLIDRRARRSVFARSCPVADGQDSILFLPAQPAKEQSHRPTALACVRVESSRWRSPSGRVTTGDLYPPCESQGRDPFGACPARRRQQQVRGIAGEFKLYRFLSLPATAAGRSVSNVGEDFRPPARPDRIEQSSDRQAGRDTDVEVGGQCGSKMLDGVASSPLGLLVKSPMSSPSSLPRGRARERASNFSSGSLKSK